MASEWQTGFVVSYKMPWCALLTAVKNYNKKSWKNARLFLQDRDQDQDQMMKTKTKTSWSKTKTKIFIFVLEAPRDQDPGLEDYITGYHCCLCPVASATSAAQHHRPWAGTKLYCLVTVVYVCGQLAQSCCPAARRATESRLSPYVLSRRISSFYV